MTRRYILFLVSLVVLSGSLTAAFATISERDYQLRGYADAARDPDLPFRIPRLGVNAELTQYDTDTLENQLGLMEQAHVTWVRQFFYWDDIEPQPGEYSWEESDRIVSAVSEHVNLRLVAVLMNSPQWTHTQGTATAPPDDPVTFGQFAHAFAERYADNIDYYQIWDEPNLTAAWGGMEPRAAHYAALLQSAYDSIHSGDTAAVVIAAALAPTVEQGPYNISDLRYLRDLYAFGVKDFMDAAAAKPYGFDDSPEDRSVSEVNLNFSRTIALHEEMVRQGDSKKALWASNWGWNSLPDDWQGAPSIWGSVSEADRVRFTTQALDRADREWPWMGGMILQHWQPDAAPDDPIWGFAVINQHDAPTALFSALANREPSDAAADGLYPAANPFAHYSGVWTFGDLGADIGWINDSQFEFDFRGREVALLLHEDDYVAYLYPTIDGEQANATPTDPNGNAYIILTSSSLEPALDLVTISRDLELGTHKLRVVADDLVPDEAQARWSLAGYGVSSGDLRAPFDCQLVVAWITTAIAAAAVLVTGAQISWRATFRPVAALWNRLSDAGQLGISAVTSIALMIGMLLTWGDGIPALFRRESVQLGVAILTAGFVYIQPGLILTLAALLVLFVIVYHRPNSGLALTIFWAPFFLFPIELLRFAFPMAEVLILVTSAAWVLHLGYEWGRIRQAVAGFLLPRIRLSGLDWAVLAWVAVGVVSLTWTDLRGPALTELRVMMIEPALFYMILRTRCSDRKTQIMLVDALLLAGFTVSVIGLWLFAHGETIITAEDGARRLASIYGSPNNLGLFLGRCFPFALAYALHPLDRRRRVFGAGIASLMLIVIALSQSAGAIFVGIPAGIVSVLLLTWGKRALLPLLGLAAAGAVGFGVALRSARFARLLDFSSGTNFARIRVWQSAINVIRDHPLTGIGLDQFLYAFRGSYIMPDAWQESDLSHPHNILLDFWVRLGLLGVVVILWIQVAFWLTARRAYLRMRTVRPVEFALIVGMMGSMVNLLGHGLVDNSIYVHDLAYVFVLLLALAANLSNVRSIDDHS